MGQNRVERAQWADESMTHLRTEGKKRKTRKTANGVVPAGDGATLQALPPHHGTSDQEEGGAVRAAGSLQGAHPVQCRAPPLLADGVPRDEELWSAVWKLPNRRTGGGSIMRAEDLKV